jgi:hypothetical protein
MRLPSSSEMFTTMNITFCKVTKSYFPGLFHYYDVTDLPRTNNDLRHYLMARKYPRPTATVHLLLEPQTLHCPECNQSM